MSEVEFKECLLGDGLRELGFTMDCGHSFEKKYPGIKIVGTYAPEYAPDPKPPVIEPNSVDFFWVGLGNPKQEIWCHKHAQEIDAVCLLPVGAVFD